MNPSELELRERRARRVYELSRLKSALLGGAPLVLLAVVAGAVGGRYVLVLAAGGLLFGLGVLSSWYGREPGRGVLPGVIGGSIALVLSLCANQVGHLCGGERCMSWCLPACLTAGLLAGGVVSYVGVKQRRGLGYWLTGSGVTMLTGALGCGCVGLSGVMGLGAGFATVAALSLLGSVLRSDPSARS